MSAVRRNVRHGDGGAIGERIARARKESGLTQEELAGLVGVSARSIQGYEAGTVVPYRHLSELAKVTNRELSWILAGDQPADLPLEVVERLVTLVEEVAGEAKRIRSVAERLERLLEAGQLAPPASQRRARDSDARPSGP
jgi:transcriptional regulator with XRE-family HTH domain